MAEIDFSWLILLVVFGLPILCGLSICYALVDFATREHRAYKSWETRMRKDGWVK